MSPPQITRRSMIRGLGVSLAFPSLESLGVTGSTSIPMRMGFAYIPNGVILEKWRPKEFGRLEQLPDSLKTAAVEHR